MAWLDEIEREQGMLQDAPTYDTLGNLAQQSWDESMSDFSSALRTTQEMGSAQREWLYRSPAENVKMLNDESAQTGVYGFSYRNDVPESIPGMTTLVYEIPEDPHGGVYVGYESYTQTYQKAQDAYQSAVESGQVSPDAEQAYQDATRTYEAQKQDYQNYLNENPNAPDYLRSSNPVESYQEYAGPQMAAENLSQKEMQEAGQDISMDVVNQKMGQGFVGVTSGKSASVEGQYAKDYQASGGVIDGDSYGIRVMDTIDKDTIDYMKSYESSGNLPEIQGEVGTDEYGRSVVARMMEIDKELQGRDSTYQSMFPENMRYYSEGENPTAIPGMTLVAMKIDGAPGYLAGYESYDTTYRTTMSDLDAQQKELNESGLSDTEMAAKQETLQQNYDSANQMYDTQKQQYETYVNGHPGNNFLDKENPVESFNGYQQQLPAQQQAQDMYGNVKEFLQDAWEKLKDVGERFMKSMKTYAPGELTEEQAMQASSSYWNQRAALEPDNKEFQQRANEANQKIASEQTTEASYSGNPFRDIVMQGTSADTSYQMQNSMNRQPYDPPVYGSTGNAMLDELSRGSTDSVDSMMRQMADSGDKGFDANLYTGASETVLDKEQPQSQTTSRSYSSQNRRSELMDRTAELEARLQQNGAAQQADFGMSMHR